MSGVTVACDQLRASGANLGTSGSVLGDAARGVDALHLGESELSYWAQYGGVVEAYTAVQQHVAYLYRDGRDALTTVGDTLIQVAAQYERTEAEIAQHAATLGHP